MSWIVAGIAVGTWAVDKIGKGVTAMGQKEDVDIGKTAAYDIQQQQLGLLGEQKDLAGQTAQLGLDVTQSQIAAGGRESVMGAQAGMRGVTDFTTSAISQGKGLATSGTITQKARTGAGDVTAKLKSDMTKLFETRQLAEREKDISLTQADLSFRKGEMSAEEAYESTLTGLSSTPTKFWEGAFG